MTFGCLICSPPEPVPYKAYEGDCKHEKIDHTYGFFASRGMRGIGIGTWCEDCGAFQWSPDFEGLPDDHEEIKWFNSRPEHKGWMIRIKEELPSVATSG